MRPAVSASLPLPLPLPPPLLSCLAICSPRLRGPIPHSSQLLYQLPQQPKFALNHIIFGNSALQRVDLLDVGCERGLSVVQLWKSLRVGEVDDAMTLSSYLMMVIRVVRVDPGSEVVIRRKGEG